MTRFPMILAAACLAGTVLAAPGADDEVLDPDRAFRPEARLVAGETSSATGEERHGIDVEYRIEPGYYLYRSRLRFEVVPATLMIGQPELPPGIEVDDPFIGRSAIFRDRVTIHLPFMVSVAKPGSYKVRITAQGCAEERICFSPFPQEVRVDIPPGYRVQDSRRIAPRGLPR